MGKGVLIRFPHLCPHPSPGVRGLLGNPTGALRDLFQGAQPSALVHLSSISEGVVLPNPLTGSFSSPLAFCSPGISSLVPARAWLGGPPLCICPCTSDRAGGPPHSFLLLWLLSLSFPASSYCLPTLLPVSLILLPFLPLFFPLPPFPILLLPLFWVLERAAWCPARFPIPALLSLLLDAPGLLHLLHWVLERATWCSARSSMPALPSLLRGTPGLPLPRHGPSPGSTRHSAFSEVSLPLSPNPPVLPCPRLPRVGEGASSVPACCSMPTPLGRLPLSAASTASPDFSSLPLRLGPGSCRPSRPPPFLSLPPSPRLLRPRLLLVAPFCFDFSGCFPHFRLLGYPPSTLRGTWGWCGCLFYWAISGLYGGLRSEYPSHLPRCCHIPRSGKAARPIIKCKGPRRVVLTSFDRAGRVAAVAPP